MLITSETVTAVLFTSFNNACYLFHDARSYTGLNEGVKTNQRVMVIDQIDISPGSLNDRKAKLLNDFCIASHAIVHNIQLSTTHNISLL